MSTRDELTKYNALSAANDSSCPDVELVALAKERVSVFPQVACDAPLAKIDEIFLPPNPPPREPIERSDLPAALVIRNREATSACATYYPGAGATVILVNALRGDFYLDTIPELSTDELYRLSPKVPALQSFLDARLHLLVDAADSTSASNFDDELISKTGVTSSLAALLRVQFLTWLSELDALAVLAARSALDCAFSSQLLWAVCDASKALGYRVEYALPAADEIFKQAEAGLSVARADQASADALSAAITAALLNCVVGNSEQVVTCDVEFETPLATPVEWNGIFYTTLAALSAAGYKAITAAQTAAVPLVYSVVEGAGLHFAATKETADTLARNAARERLRCFYPSPPVIRRCTDADVSPPVNARFNALVTSGASITEDKVLSELITGDYNLSRNAPDNVGFLVSGPVDALSYSIDTTNAPQVILPGGMFVAATEALALAEAVLHARQFLRCEWNSPTYACACLQTDNAANYVWASSFSGGKPQLYDSAGRRLPVAFNRTKSVDKSAFPYGMLVDSGFPGQSLAQRFPWDVTLRDLCKASLTCVFCNEQVDPTCVTATFKSVLTPYTLWRSGNAVPLSLTGADYNNYNISSTITGGAAAAAVCDNDPANVTAQAQALAQLPPAILNGGVSAKPCLFTNDKVTAHCKLGAFLLEDSDIPSYLYTGSNSLVTIKLVSASLQGQARALSLTNASVTVPAGTYTSSVSKQEATKTAYVFARAALTCEYGYTGDRSGPRMLCGAPTNIPIPSTSAMVSAYGQGKLATDLLGTSVSPKSQGSSLNPVYLGPFISPVDIDVAVAGAYTRALAALNCFYEAEQTAVCEAKPDTRQFSLDGRKIDRTWHEVGSLLGAAGQKALFKYSGLAVFEPTPGGTYKRKINVSTVTPSAKAKAVSFVSLALASLDAYTAALSNLDCTHVNWPRTWSRCPRASDRLTVQGVVGVNAVEATSTKEANIQAEQLGKSLSVCEECAPFRLVVSEVGSSIKLFVCAGSATFWSLASGAGAGAKLSSCVADTEGLTLKDLKWRACTSSFPAGGVSLGSSNSLFWLKIACCGSAGTTKPSVTLIQEGASGYSAQVLSDPGFYPTKQYETKLKETAALWIYVGNTVVRATPGEDGRRARVNQHTDENVQITGGGGGSGPFRLKVDGTKYTIAPGSIMDGTNGKAVDLGRIFTIEGGPVVSHAATAGFVVLTASVDENLIAKSWQLKVVSSTSDADEVKLSTGKNPKQEKITLLLGKIVIKKNIPQVIQSSFTSMRLIHGVYNGILVRVLESAPTHAIKL